MHLTNGGRLRGIRIEASPPAPDLTVPPELIAICSRAVQKDPARRYQSAEEFAEDIQRFQSGALVQSYE